MEVCLDASAVPADPRGAGRYVVDLVDALARRDDVEVRLVTRRGDTARWPVAAAITGAPRARPLRLVWEQTVLPLRLRRARFDVYHGPHYTMPLRLLRRPRVVTVHDLTFFDHPEWHEPAKVRYFTRAIRASARRADAIVCVSATTASRLRDLLDPQAPVHVVPHGVDHDRFRPEAREGDAPELAALGVKGRFVAFVGTIEPRKDVPTLVRAFETVAARHPDLSLVIAGGKGWGSAADELDAAVRSSHHRDRIVRTGYVGDAAVGALLRHAEVVAYPSLEEGFGLPALEAMACGTPLVTTAGTAMAEVAAGAAILVPPADAAGLADGIERALAGGADLSSGLVRAGAHTWARSAEQHLAVYRSVR